MISVVLVGIVLIGVLILVCLGVGNLSWFVKMILMEMVVFS